MVHMSGILTMWYVELYVARKGLIFSWLYTSQVGQLKGLNMTVSRASVLCRCWSLLWRP